MSTIIDKLRNTEAAIRAAAEHAERHVEDVQLVAVSKTKPVEAIKELYDAGHRHFGENYFQELCQKAPLLPNDIQWHFIGHLQSQKASPLIRNVPNLSCIETVDSEKLARKLNNAVEGAGRAPLVYYLQVDTSGEDSKSGVDPNNAPELVASIIENCPHLVFKGLMTIGSPGDLTCFDRLIECRHQVADALGIDEKSLALSMGMSGDFEAAIGKGSTSVRVGSNIFGARDYLEKKDEPVNS
jgi:pyridoxal phosphate enzyme (YggS family)